MGNPLLPRRRKKRKRRKNHRSGAKAKRGRNRAARRHLARIGVKGDLLMDEEDIIRVKLDRERLSDLRLSFHLRALHADDYAVHANGHSPYRE